MATLFSKIIERKIPAEFVYEDDLCVAIRDINPKAPVHALVVPRKVLSNISEATKEDRALLGHLLLVANAVAKKEGLSGGYRLVVNSGNDGGQEVPHLHIHVLGGRQMTWPPG